MLRDPPVIPPVEVEVRGLLTDRLVGAGAAGGRGAPDSREGRSPLTSDRRVAPGRERRLDGSPPPADFPRPQLHGAPDKTEASRRNYGSTFRFHADVGNRRVQDTESL